MQLTIKPDYAQAKARIEAFWERRVLDRPPVTIWVSSDRRSPSGRVKQHASLRERWMDVDFQIDRVEASVANGTYLAETFPIYMPNLGPDICASIFGAELEFGTDTSWSHPVVENVRDICHLKPSFDNPYWNTIRRLTDESIQRGQGRWITGVTDLHTNGDVVAALRGPQNLAVDMADDLEGVRLACEYVTDFFPALFNDLWQRIRAAGQPCTTWTPLLHDGPWYVPNCDFICMVSNDMFEKAIFPSIRREGDILKCSIFHLDGPGALQHLDSLLRWPELNAVQWVYGAGNGPAARWIDVYRRIQNAGKGIQLIAEDTDDARVAARQLDPRGVWFCVGGAHTRTQAEDFLAWVEEWGHKG